MKRSENSTLSQKNASGPFGIISCSLCESDIDLESQRYEGVLAWPSDKATYITYICGELNCGMECLYCIMCLKTIGYENMDDHSERAHSNFDEIIYMDDIVHHKINCSSVYVQSYISRRMRDFYDTAPHLHLVSLLNDCNYDYSDVKGALNRRIVKNEIPVIIEEHVFGNNYACKFCGILYDSIPTEILVHNHIVTCSYLDDLRNPNKITT